MSNAPHVAFFLPIIGELSRRGHAIIVSMRDFNQTVELARKRGIVGSVIGRHGGKSALAKMLNLLLRSNALVAFGKAKRVDVAVSHNSYTQTIAGRLIAARVVTIMDYEGQPANHIAFRMAHRVIVPVYFPEKHLQKFGAGREKVWKYEGFKEQVYLTDFRPSESFFPEFIRLCGLGDRWDPERTVLVTIRTPASMAAYHHFKNLLFEGLLEKLERHPEATVLLLPRTMEQTKYYREKFPLLHMPVAPLDGNELVYHSDLLISAGGTMNREAAILGTPVYTIFAGELPAVDRALIGMGRLKTVETKEDLDSIQIVKKKQGTLLGNSNLLREIVDKIVAW